MTPAPLVPTVPIGHIDRDVLRYHGTYPFSQWGKAWTRVFSKVPDDAAYMIYDHYVRKTGVLPVPPLQFQQEWLNKAFRIFKSENGGTTVLALYKHDDDFYLISANIDVYERWATKNDAESFVRPKFSMED